MDYVWYNIFYLMTFIFVLVANSMLIYGFHKTSRPFTIVTKLFIYLSICEVAMITCILTAGVVLFVEGYTNHNLFIVLFLLIYLLTFSDLLIFWTISFLRFLSIYKPMYRFKTRTVNTILVSEIVASLLAAVTIIAVFIKRDVSFTEMAPLYSNIKLCAQLVLTFMILSLNMSSVILLRGSTNSKAQQATDNVSNNGMVIKQKKKATTTLLSITIILLVCSIPLTCLSFFKLDDFMRLGNGYMLLAVSFQCLQFTSYGINSLIVILRTKNLSKFYKIRCCLPNQECSNVELRMS